MEKTKNSNKSTRFSKSKEFKPISKEIVPDLISVRKSENENNSK